MVPLQPPLEPMLARLERSLPTGPGLSYELKWDGFRCLAFSSAGDVALLSRNAPLTRYFPEVVAGILALGDVVLDGELLAQVDGRSCTVEQLR
jgi:ATP-dependent DNA ligase